MIRRLCSVVALMFATSVSVTAAQQTSPLSAAIAATQAQKRPYTFDYALDGTQINWRARFDPNGATPHLHLVSPAHLEGAQQHAFEGLQRDMDGVSWCASSALGHATEVRLLSEDASTI